jgi:ketosteroid isomerase-like protein
MRPARVIAVLGAAYALAGCGASAGDQVQAKLQQFAHAVSNRDATTLCRQVLAPALVQHLAAAGLSCEQAMRTFVDSVADPTLAVSKVHVKGAAASAVVLTGARGQKGSLESVQLADTKAGWRLTSLASPR